jgi:hypothetical protein
MRYIVAMIFSAVLVAAMFAYTHWMMLCVAKWRDTNATLPEITCIGIKLAYAIANFWYIIVPFLFAIPLIIAALWPRKKRDDCQVLS